MLYLVLLNQQKSTDLKHIDIYFKGACILITLME